MTVRELSLKDGFTVLALPDGEREIGGVYIGDLLSWVMGRAREDNAWITIMSNINVVAVASLTDISCIILAEDVTVDENIIDTAVQKHVNILSTAKNAYDVSIFLNKVI